MDGTPVRDFQKSCALILVEPALDLDVPVDHRQPDVTGFTRGTILGVDPRMSQADGHALERPLFPPRVHPHGHRRARPERTQ